jgi:hypothetical protein
LEISGIILIFVDKQIMLYAPRIPTPPPISDIRKLKNNMKEEVTLGQVFQEMEKESAIEYCEREFPQMMEEFKKIQSEMYETFCKKQRNYGPGNISVGTSLQTKEDVKLSLTGLWFRINDKVQRLKQLVVLGQPDEVGESVQDTYQDLSVYGIIAQLVQRGKWAK